MLLSLHSLQLNAPLDRSGQCLVLVELILPRPAIARRAVLKTVELRQGTRSLAREPFYETALLKEKVDGRFGLKVSVTRPLQHPELQLWLRRLLASGLESIPSLAPFAALQAPVEDLLDTASEQLADHVLRDQPFIATGGLDLNSARLPSGAQSLALHLTTRLRRSELPPGPQSRERRKSEATTYRKGSQVGQLVLDFE